MTESGLFVLTLHLSADCIMLFYLSGDHYLDLVLSYALRDSLFSFEIHR
jgi:hypothetical protein